MLVYWLPTIIKGAVVLLVLIYVYFFTKKFTKSNKCIKCGSDDLVRIKRPVATRILLFFLNFQRYRCQKCWKEFYVFPSKNSEK